MSLTVTQLRDGRKAVIIRTSDRITFKRCRRKWAFSSHLKRDLGAKNLAAPLWFGSAFHYALEDFHGVKQYKSAADALTAFMYATAQNFSAEIPGGAQELLQMGRAMLDYYETKWLKFKPSHTTYIEDGIHQTEVSFEIPMEVPQETLDALGVDCVLYRGTLDAVAIDEHGHLWIVEYKTAKRAEHNHYMTDPQISAYMWAAQMIYDKPVVGVIYYQFVKGIPDVPKILASGKVSTSSTQRTSYPLYLEQLVAMYGHESKAPKANVDYLWELCEKESPDKDAFIQRERVYRGQFNYVTEPQKILLELEDMLNPDLPLYPNPTRDCSFTCSFLTACTNMDDGSDWEAELEDSFAPRGELDDKHWRRRLMDISQMRQMQFHGYPDLEMVNAGLANVPQNNNFNPADVQDAFDEEAVNTY